MSEQKRHLETMGLGDIQMPDPNQHVLSNPDATLKGRDGLDMPVAAAEPVAAEAVRGVSTNPWEGFPGAEKAPDKAIEPAKAAQPGAAVLDSRPALSTVEATEVEKTGIVAALKRVVDEIKEFAQTTRGKAIIATAATCALIAAVHFMPAAHVATGAHTASSLQSGDIHAAAPLAVGSLVEKLGNMNLFKSSGNPRSKSNWQFIIGMIVILGLAGSRMSSPFHGVPNVVKEPTKIVKQITEPITKAQQNVDRTTDALKDAGFDASAPVYGEPRLVEGIEITDLPVPERAKHPRFMSDPQLFDEMGGILRNVLAAKRNERLPEGITAEILEKDERIVFAIVKDRMVWGACQDHLSKYYGSYVVAEFMRLDEVYNAVQSRALEEPAGTAAVSELKKDYQIFDTLDEMSRRSGGDKTQYRDGVIAKAYSVVSRHADKLREVDTLGKENTEQSLAEARKILKETPGLAEARAWLIVGTGLEMAKAPDQNNPQTPEARLFVDLYEREHDKVAVDAEKSIYQEYTGEGGADKLHAVVVSECQRTISRVQNGEYRK